MNHFFFYADGQMCVLLIWGTPATRMHYGRKANHQRQCDGVAWPLPAE